MTEACVWFLLFKKLSVQPLNGSAPHVMPLAVVTPRESIRVNANIRAVAHWAVIKRLTADESTVATAPEPRVVGVVVDRGCAVGLYTTMTHGAWTERVHVLRECVFITVAHCLFLVSLVTESK